MNFAQESGEARRERAMRHALGLDEFTFYSLRDGARISLQMAQELARSWEKDGLAIVVRTGERRRKVFSMTPLARRLAKQQPKQPIAEHEATPAGNMWLVMRKMGLFSRVDVAAHATTDTVQVSEQEAGDYCRLLARGGYLRIAAKEVRGKREAMYRLIRDTGPKPPAEKRVTAIFDPNVSRLTYIAGMPG
ncbi:hypothetical protein [Pseudoruegeria sp. HB172150]|uniref:hypothetical protein n=1 Tax=Pseudoruegeria sp. HB172150 TaxID=2721164 RepID=UPI001551F744|nr:hypothetical protein [Pseudoruegeria sp. HB172150]